MRSKNSWALLLMLLSGIVLGGFITMASIIGVIIAILTYHFI